MKTINEKIITQFLMKHKEDVEKVLMQEIKDQNFIEIKNGIKWSEKVRLRLQDRKDWEDENKRRAIEDIELIKNGYIDDFVMDEHTIEAVINYKKKKFNITEEEIK